MNVAHVDLWDWTSAAKTIQDEWAWQQQLSMSACAYLHTDILTVHSACSQCPVFLFLADLKDPAE